MKQKKNIIIIFSLIVIITSIYLVSVQKIKWSIKYHFSTQTISNTNIDNFISKLDLPKAQGINIDIEIQKKDLKIFSVEYGDPHDCMSGCFYSNATGLKYGNKIGWISVNNYDNIDSSKFTMYDFDSSDTYLYSEEFFQTLKSKDDQFYQEIFLPKIAQDVDTPRQTLVKIAKGLSSYIQPHLANILLENDTSKKDKEILTIIANLPVFTGDAYKEVRIKAKQMLD